jgi:hypothetical protein
MPHKNRSEKGAKSLLKEQGPQSLGARELEEWSTECVAPGQVWVVRAAAHGDYVAGERVSKGGWLERPPQGGWSLG